MGFTTIRSSDIGDRLDAGFHLALSPVRGLVEELRATVPVEEVRAALARLRPADMTPTLVLSRRLTSRPDASTVATIVQEYPYEALALMQDGMHRVSQQIRDRIADEHVRLAALHEVSAIRPGAVPRLEAGHAYPLRETGSYDDEAAEGYDYAAIPDDAGPGTSGPRDAWIVDASGGVHPGMADRMVSVRVEDVRIQDGRPVAVRHPAPASTGP